MSFLCPWRSRRRFLQTAGLLFGIGANGHVGVAAERPRVGAIRWDAWYDPNDGSVAQAMETALGPARYHDRMPFFGSEVATDRVRINGDYQPIMDQEIALGSRAGLDYWAFVGYSVNNSMSNALKLYLASKSRSKIGFCMIGSIANGGSVDHFSDRTLQEVSVMQEQGYVRVLGDRPLYYVLSAPKAQIEAEWGGYKGVAKLIAFVRATAREKKCGNPYVVFLGADASTMTATGADAIGNYAIVGNPDRSSYSKLAQDAKARWDQLAASGVGMVPTVMTGWDQRPLIENPPDWDRSFMAKGVGIDKYYARAAPSEMAEHLQDAIAWTESHRSATPANTVLIYAWNECGEGYGALVPSFQRNNPLGDSSRLNGISKVLNK